MKNTTKTNSLSEELLETLKNHAEIVIDTITQNNDTNTQQTPNILVTRRNIAWISYNYQLSIAAKEQLTSSNFIDKGLKKLIFDAPLAWQTQLSTIIAIDLYNYIEVEIYNDLPLITKIESTKQISEQFTVVDKMIEDYNIFNEIKPFAKNKDKNSLLELLWNESINYGIKISKIQRILSIGFANAARIMECLEANNFLSEIDENKNRKVICQKDEFMTTMTKILDEQ